MRLGSGFVFAEVRLLGRSQSSVQHAIHLLVVAVLVAHSCKMESTSIMQVNLPVMRTTDLFDHGLCCILLP